MIARSPWLGTEVHPRYGSWQLNRLSNPRFNFPKDVARFHFLGLTEHYRTTLCLFFFTFQVCAPQMGAPGHPGSLNFTVLPGIG
jgi:hypothetical protein